MGRVMRVASLALIAMLTASQAAAAGDSFRALLVVYRCEVVHRLEQIYVTGNPASDHDRFIAVTVPNHPHGYVQCIFHDHQTGLYCEAASGWWYDKEGAPRTFRQPPETIAALARMGFDTDDSKGNFNIDLTVADPPDFNAAADFILRALHDGYGARGEMNLRFNAPFAPKAPSTCVPVS
jgi:hypothetical protein